MTAAKQDNRVAARLLLKRGAEVDATDNEGRTALLDASKLEMKRLLLDAGADPDRGRIAGMTLTALFASFREREIIDFLIAYGANPEERTREGLTVRDILKDPATVWTKPFPMNAPEHRRRVEAAILQLSDGFRLAPEAFVAEHRDILIWSFGSYPYDDPALAAWAVRVSDLLGSPDRLEAAYRLHMEGETREAALRSLIRPRRRAERERHRRERAAEFEAMHLSQG